VQPVEPQALREAFLEEVRRQKRYFHGTVIAQAQRITVEGDRIVIAFGPQHRALRAQLEQTRPLLETIATQLAGRRMTVASVEKEGTASTAAAAPPPAAEQKEALRQQALADSGVQAMLDVFGGEIKEVEEM
jgi:hypothetical protein